MSPIVEKRLLLINQSKNGELKKVLFEQSVRCHGNIFYIGENVFFIEGCNISIGKNVTISDNVSFLDFDLITIGDNVYLGRGVTIYPNVTIGNNVKIESYTNVKESIFC